MEWWLISYLVGVVGWLVAVRVVVEFLPSLQEDYPWVAALSLLWPVVLFIVLPVMALAYAVSQGVIWLFNLFKK